jgi:hypothetical protein
MHNAVHRSAKRSVMCNMCEYLSLDYTGLQSGVAAQPIGPNNETIEKAIKKVQEG